MHYGSSEEKDSEEEAGPQDRGGEKVDGEEDGHCSSQDREEEEITFQRRGVRPRASFIFPLKNKRLPNLASSSAGGVRWRHSRSRRLANSLAKQTSCAVALTAG
ncbi:MAG: hypothetical protein ACRECI_10350 [Methyloceanibacter sp.]